MPPRRSSNERAPGHTANRVALVHRDGTHRTFGWHCRIDRDGMRFIVSIKADGPAVYAYPVTA